MINDLFYYPFESVIIVPVSKQQRNIIHSGITLLIILGLVSCGGGALAQQTPEPTLEPTPTELPMAARVNGEGVLLSEYEAEMQRYKAAMDQLGQTYDAAAASQEVVDELVNQTLLAQVAAAQGYSKDDAALQTELDSLIQAAGGTEVFQAWLAANYYNEENFRYTLKRNMAASWMKDKISADVPTSTEQVHARQILVSSQGEAEALQRQLQAGTITFETLAFQYDELTGGELGWFPRGYLLVKEVEDAAFSMEAGSFSGVISSSYGYHLIEVIEKDPAHVLSPDALLFLQHQTFNTWLEQQRAQSTIEVMIP